MNDQRRLLVWQSDSIISKIQRKVNNYEFLIVAGAFQGIDQPILADKYFKLAMNAKDSTEKGIATRSYARYLFVEGKLDEARERYEECLHYFKGDRDGLVSYRFDTFLRWAQQEKEWKNKAQELQLLEEAKHEISLMRNPTRRENEEKRVNSLIEKPVKANIPEKSESPTPAGENLQR